MYNQRKQGSSEDYKLLHKTVENRIIVLKGKNKE
jgi:hypothetical protein